MAGPDPEKRLLRFHARRSGGICEKRFGKSCIATSMGRILRELGLSRQKARPSHPQKDPAAQRPLKRAPALLRKIQRTHKNKRLRLFFQDEARIGQKGRVCHIWWKRGERPPGLCDKRFTFAYIFAAVEPGTDNAFALVLPYANTEAMQAFLDASPRRSPRRARRAGSRPRRLAWPRRAARARQHHARVPLPPYSPELNPVERVWLYLKERFLSLRLLNDYDAIADAACKAWNRLLAETGRITSLCSTPGS